MKVLIADDEINIILLIKSLIDRQKTDVEIAGEAGDGITALEMVRQLKPDVVITDIRMPGMNGMDLIRHVREEQIPVEFVLSAATVNSSTPEARFSMVYQTIC